MASGPMAMPKSKSALSTASMRRAFFHQELRFAAIRAEHAIADEAAAIAHQHANLAELLRKLHAGGDHVLAGFLAAHDFEQSHHVGRAEEVRADHRLRARSGGGDFVDAQRGSIASENRSRLADAVELAEDFLLERHAFEDRFDHHVDRCEAVVSSASARCASDVRRRIAG